jgi:hypothetical protein
MCRVNLPIREVCQTTILLPSFCNGIGEQPNRSHLGFSQRLYLPEFWIILNIVFGILDMEEWTNVAFGKIDHFIS